MSQGDPIPLDRMRLEAEHVAQLLAPACERIEIAGSIRRRKALVRDIELVAIPSVVTQGGLFGDAEDVNLLDLRIAELVEQGDIQRRESERHHQDGSVDRVVLDGAAYKTLAIGGYPIDLFITDPIRWGCIFALRTGPGDWNTRLVTDCKRHFRAVADGRVLAFSRVVDTPEEPDFFRALGVPWIEPWERAVDRLRFDTGILRGLSS